MSALYAAFEPALVGLIVLLAAVALLRRLGPRRRPPTRAGCGACRGCDGAPRAH